MMISDLQILLRPFEVQYCASNHSSTQAPSPQYYLVIYELFNGFAFFSFLPGSFLSAWLLKTQRGL